MFGLIYQPKGLYLINIIYGCMITKLISLKEMSKDRSKEESVYNLIILALSEDWPLTARKLFYILKNKKKMTYQAVHKALQQLLKNKIVLKNNNEYLLNISWIHDAKKFLTNLEYKYSGVELLTEEEIRREIKEEQVMHLSFTTKIELGRFVIEKFLKLPNPENKIAICRWNHMYNLFGLPPDYLEILREKASKTQFYLISQCDTKFDKFLAKFYKKMNGKIKLGVDCAVSRDSFVWGDYVAQVFWTYNARLQTDKKYRSIRNPDSIDLAKISMSLFKDKSPSKVVVVKNKVFADQLRQETLLQYKTEKKEQILGLISFKIEKNKKTYEFKNFDSAEKFRKKIQSIYFSKPRRQPYVAKTFHLRSPLIYSQRSLNRINAVKKNQLLLYILVKGKTITDKWIAELYEKSSGSMISSLIGIKFKEPYEIMVCGSDVVIIEIPLDIIKKMDIIYSKVKRKGDIDIAELYDNVYCPERKIKVIVEKNPNEAKKLRKDIIECFNDN
jgi:hypothetical protein